MAVTHLHNGLKCIKYLLFAVNSLFMLTGLMIISIGYSIYAIYDYLGQFLGSDYVSPALILFVVGGLTFVIAFFGCLGAMRESTAMVLVFTVSLSIVLILEMSAVVTAFALRNGINDVMASRIFHTMAQYNRNIAAKKAVDTLQRALGCCGSRSADDWLALDLKLGGTNRYYPTSCRSPFHGRIFENGCNSELTSIVNDSAMYIATGALAIMLIQMCGIIFATSLGKAIRQQKTEREMRRWQFRQSLVNDYQPLQQKNINFAQISQYTEQPLKDIQ